MASTRVSGWAVIATPKAMLSSISFGLMLSAIPSPNAVQGRRKSATIAVPPRAPLAAAVNPKTLMMAISAGLSIGAAALDVGQQAVVTVIFVTIASFPVAIPVIGYLVAAERMRSPLDSMRSWLTHNNATIMSVLLLDIGVVVASKGIQQF